MCESCVCERVTVCVKELCVCDKVVCERDVCERVVCDSVVCEECVCVWQNYVWQKCVWVGCAWVGRVWKSCVWQSIVCERRVWRLRVCVYVTKMCAKSCVCAEVVADGGSAQQINKNPTQWCGGKKKLLCVACCIYICRSTQMHCSWCTGQGDAFEQSYTYRLHWTQRLVQALPLARRFATAPHHGSIVIAELPALGV